jgi:hypothetical protein
VTETVGGKLYQETNERIKTAFGELLGALQPAKGEKIDPEIHGLLVEINVHLRDAMYRVMDISTLVDRKAAHGDRLDAKP